MAPRLSSGAYFETMLYHIGTVSNKGHIEHFEIYLDDPLASGQGIDLFYRRYSSDDWIKVGGSADSTFSFAADGAKSEKVIPWNIDKVVNIQFKATFATSGNT